MDVIGTPAMYTKYIKMTLQDSFNVVSFTMALLASLNYWFVREPIIKNRKQKLGEVADSEQSRLE